MGFINENQQAALIMVILTFLNYINKGKRFMTRGPLIEHLHLY
ncbi:MAG: hypothetical protein Q8M40_12920 [Legionella sp.]|nr:hypothetical protein [Legionella sp.]